MREPVVAGTFYPSNPTELKAELASFFEAAENKTINKTAAAIIVPHAGYVFSGQVAASAYAQIDPEKQFENIFIIGTSHHTVMNGASIYNRGNYRTPLGIVEVNLELANKLLVDSKYFKFNAPAHSREHSIEVQLPFLQYWLKKPFKIVPVIISTQTASTCQKIAEVLKPYFNKDNLFVISSDFSHYPNYADAVKTDKLTADAIKTNSPELFASTVNDNAEKNIPGLATSCCGWSSVLTLLCITSETPGINIQHVKYMNSGDTSYGDRQRVVGYNSFVFSLNDAKTSAVNFSLSPTDKKELIQLARETIESELNKRELPQIPNDKISESIQSPCGAFVTLTKNGKLRGCIGRFVSAEPLYKVVQEMALSSAFQDTRFSPVKLNELKDIEVEISVLTPLKKISSADEFELGKQGIYMIKGRNSGTFLPQVATKTNWTKEEFLGHCAQDKAGIGWNGWKDADLYTYEALVFSEKELLTQEK
jgi:AmmeMemoRadiSam system protein B/AmmeMemoRadiSam system protein A